ncbi:MAG: murein biosynthesis integral membrane protein MurJ [Phycisphaerae bacterium]
MTDDRQREHRHFFGAAKVVAAITLLSRVAGLVRDQAIVALGATRATDAFWTAFSIPNLFRRLFGEGALSAAFVPVFTEVAETRGWDRARLLLANVLGVLALGLLGLGLLVGLGLLAVLAFAPGQWDRQLLLQLTMVQLPFMVTVCLLAIASAGLNCHGHFWYPAFAPILLNLCLIAAAAVVHWTFPPGSTGGLFVLSAAVVTAGVVQLVGVMWLLRRTKLAAVPSVRPLLAETRRIASLALPMMIPLGLSQFSALFDRLYAWFLTATEPGETLEVLGWQFAKPLEPGVITCLYAGARLQQFPMGILAVSLATAVFPLLSRYASRQDVAGLSRATNRAMRLAMFLGIPSGVALIVLAEPSISLIYGHGRFDASDVARSSLILRMYSVGMWAYFANHILLRAFFSQKDTMTPLKISLVLTVLNMLLVAVGVFSPLRGGAVGLATAFTASVQAVTLAWVLRRRWGRIGLRRIAVSVARTVAASGGMAAAVWGTYRYAGGLVSSFADPGGKPAVGLSLAAAIAVGMLTYLLAVVAMRCPELGELLGKGDDEAAENPSP